MKKLKTEIRLYLAELFMGWAFDLAPSDNQEGKEIKAAVAEYFIKQEQQWL